VGLRTTNGGIVDASNDALERATGEFVVLLDHDDVLDPHALAEVAAAVDADPEIDYLYSDEDHLTLEGHRVDAFYKPDWSPERLRSQNYCCHLSVLRRRVVDEVGRFRPGFDGSQDYDLILRVSEQARHVHHIPRTLYHWRRLPTSAAASTSAKPYAYDAGRRAIQEHCDRIGIDAVVEEQDPPGTYRVRRKVHGDPLVSIIIPTCGSRGRVWGVERDYVVGAVQSVLEQATHTNVEFVIVADDTTPAPVIAALERLAGDRLKVVWYDRPFNFSEKINLGRQYADGEFLLLLNDDIELISRDFIEVMVGIAQDADVGSVGAKLLFSDGTLQHAGHVYNGDPYHIFFKWHGSEIGPSSMLKIARECIGVTAACLVIRPEVFDAVGGLSTEFASNFNDVDFALKLRRAGFRNVWTPYAELYHFESVTRDPTVTPEEYALLRRRWDDCLTGDPYYNDNLVGNRYDWVERGIR
jgi:O-antigen biosynthesis protein